MSKKCGRDEDFQISRISGGAAYSHKKGRISPKTMIYPGNMHINEFVYPSAGFIFAYPEIFDSRWTLYNENGMRATRPLNRIVRACNSGRV